MVLSQVYKIYSVLPHIIFTLKYIVFLVSHSEENSVHARCTQKLYFKHGILYCDNCASLLALFGCRLCV